MNAELSHPNDWFHVNKLSLNADKTKYVLFRKVKSKDSLPLVLTIYLLMMLKSKGKTH